MTTQNFAAISNQELHTSLQDLVMREKVLSLEIIHNLREVDRRRLWAQMAYPSLFTYCMRELGYSETQASRRISAMRVIREMPEIEAKVATGELTLSTVSQAHTFFRRESKVRKFSIREKKEIFDSICGKTQKEVALEFAKISPEQLPPDVIRPLSDTHSEIKFAGTTQFTENLRRARELTAHSNPRGDLNTLLNKALEALLNQIDPLRKKGRVSDEKHDSPPAPERKPKPINNSHLGLALRINAASSPLRAHIPAHVRRVVWKRDGSSCTYLDPRTKNRCESRYGLEIDHMRPLALGGGNEITNLRLLCRNHNQLAAIQKLGRDKMKPFIKDISELPRAK